MRRREEDKGAWDAGDDNRDEEEDGRGELDEEGEAPLVATEVESVDEWASGSAYDSDVRERREPRFGSRRATAAPGKDNSDPNSAQYDTTQ